MITMSDAVFAGDNLTFARVPSLDPNSTPKNMILKARQLINNSVGAKAYNGFEVTDADGNTFYVDDIEKPDKIVYLNYVEDQTGAGPKSEYNFNGNIVIEKLIFK